MNAGIDAALFYLSVTSLVAGAIRVIRAVVETRTRVKDRIGIALTAAGLIGLAVAVGLFVSGPKTVLPF